MYTLLYDMRLIRSRPLVHHLVILLALIFCPPSLADEFRKSGDTEILYKSIQQKYFTLPDDTLVYPCHDYENRRISTIAQEKARNIHIGGAKSLEEFRLIMAQDRFRRAR